MARLRQAVPWLVAAVSSMAGCLGDAAADQATDGRLDVGDSWTTRVRHVEDGDDDGFTFTLTETVVGRSVRGGHDTFEVRAEYGFPPEFERPGRSFLRTETRWLRASDLAEVERASHTETNLFGEEYADVAGLYTTDSSVVHGEPCPTLAAMALEVGQEWTATCSSAATSVERDPEGREERFNHTSVDVTAYRVEGRETVHVAGGTFTAYRVASSTDDPRSGDDAGAAMTWVAGAQCPPVPVKAESWYRNEEHGGDSTTELVAVSC